MQETVETVIPIELQQLPHWIKWTYREGGRNKPLKVPLQVNGHEAKTNDPSTWTTFNSIKDSDKIGFCFTESSGVIGIDFDDAVNADGSIKPWAKDIIEKLQSYTEYSPSGKGLHILAKANVDMSKFKKKYKISETEAIEIYNNGRYFTVTGNQYGSFKYRDVTPEMEQVLGELNIKPEATLGTTIAPLSIEVPNEAKYEDAKACLNALTTDYADDYDKWLTVGMALKAVADNETTLKLWDEFSKRSKKYDGTCGTKWDTFNQSGETAIGFDSLVFYAKGCDPEFQLPSTIAGLQKVRELQSVGKKDNPPKKEYEENHAGNAQRMLNIIGYEVAWMKDLQKWKVWTGKVWEEDQGCLQAKYDLVAPSIKKEADEIKINWEKAKAGDEEEEKKAYKKKRLQSWAVKCGNAQVMTGTLTMAKSIFGFHRTENDFNTDNHLLNTPSGIVDLKTGQLSPHDSTAMCSNITSVGYDPSVGTNCPLFLNTIEIGGGDQELTDWLQVFLGYCLTGHTSLKKMLYMWGVSDSGKSSIIRVVSDILGTYTLHGNIATLEKGGRQRSGADHSTDIKALKGKRFAVFPEATKKSHRNELDEEKIKTLTGGSDKITARGAYDKAQTTFASTAKIIVHTNHELEFSGDTATHNRLLIVKFKNSIINIDGDYDTKIIKEYPAILNWLVQGAMKFYANGMKLPYCKAVEIENQEVIIDSPSIKAFFNSLVWHSEDQKDYTLCSTVYEWFKDWAKAKGVIDDLPKERKFAMDFADCYRRKFGKQGMKKINNARVYKCRRVFAKH